MPKKAVKQLNYVDVLQKFVSKDTARKNIQQPWCEGTRSFAADGHVLISIPRQKGLLNREGIYKICGRLPPVVENIIASHLPQSASAYCWLPVPTKAKDLDTRKVGVDSHWHRSYKYVHQLWAGRAIQYTYAKLIIQQLRNVHIACEFTKGNLAEYHDKPLAFRADDDIYGLIMPIRLLRFCEIKQLAAARTKYKNEIYPTFAEQWACIHAMAGTMETNVSPICVLSKAFTIHK
ncbi:MAG: hypothetical protein AAB649_01895, partial [Patescibacteria group bacterium]